MSRMSLRYEAQLEKAKDLLCGLAGVKAPANCSNSSIIDWFHDKYAKHQEKEQSKASKEETMTDK